MLASERYWDKWDRISEGMLQEIGKGFLERLWRGREESPESLLFDTTNYFTYMATKTRSKLAVRGRNKSGKHHLCQVGLGLLVDRAASLPLYYTVYPGNLHDSNLFHRVMDEFFGVIAGFSQGQKQLTVIFDKGMNSEENIALIDGRKEIHNYHWSTEQIVTASLDRSHIEKQFRVSKAPCHVRVNPIFHWTDSKIRCHLLTCLIALSALRLLEILVGRRLSAKTIIEEMRNLNLVLTWHKGQKRPQLHIEHPDPMQAQVLAALGHKIENGSVLHI